MEQSKEMAELLDMYFEGRTTQEQERLLREYLESGNVHPDHFYARAMFDMFRRASCMTAPSAPFAEKSAAGNLQTKARAAGKRTWAAPKLTRVAAALAGAACIAFAIYLAVGKEPTEKIYCYMNGEAVTDRNIAMQQAEAAGMLLREGLETTRDGITGVDKARHTLTSLNMAVELLDNSLGIPQRIASNSPENTATQPVIPDI